MPRGHTAAAQTKSDTAGSPDTASAPVTPSR